MVAYGLLADLPILSRSQKRGASSLHFDVFPELMVYARGVAPSLEIAL